MAISDRLWRRSVRALGVVVALVVLSGCAPRDADSSGAGIASRLPDFSGFGKDLPVSGLTIGIAAGVIALAAGIGAVFLIRPPKRGGVSKKFIIAGAGTVAVIVAGVVAATMLLPKLSTPEAPEGLLRNYDEKPVADWSFAPVPRGEQNYGSPMGILSLEEDRALTTVWLNQHADELYDMEGYSLWWTESYDAEYDAGYSDGTEYMAAVDEWYSADDYYYFPEAEDYRTYEEYESAGYDDGFLDGYEAMPDARRVQKLTLHEAFSTVTMLDTRDGSVLWDLDLSSEVDGQIIGVSMMDIEGTDSVVLVTVVNSGSRFGVFTVDNGSGTIRSHTVLEDPMMTPGDTSEPFVKVLHGHLLTAHTHDYESFDLALYDPADLEKGPLWEVPSEFDAYYARPLLDRFAVLDGSLGNQIIDITDGSSPDWAWDHGTEHYDDSYYFVDHVDVDGHLLRVEGDLDFMDIEGISTDDQPTWDRPVDASWMDADHGVLLIGEEDDDYRATDIERLDPATGEPMWDSPLRASFRRLETIVDGHLVFSDDRNRVVFVDAATGEAGATHNLRDMSVATVYAAPDYAYVVGWDEVVAVSPDESRPAWRMRLRSDDYLSQVGDHLATENLQRTEIRVFK